MKKNWKTLRNLRDNFKKILLKFKRKLRIHLETFEKNLRPIFKKGYKTYTKSSREICNKFDRNMTDLLRINGNLRKFG